MPGSFEFRSGRGLMGVVALCLHGALAACGGGGDGDAGHATAMTTTSAPTATASSADRGVVPADQLPSVTSSSVGQLTDVDLQLQQQQQQQQAAEPAAATSI